MNLFERAVRSKLRFSSNKGVLSVEDLFDLSLVALDNIAQSVNKKLKESSGESFIGKKTTENDDLELRLDILKHIIADKLKAKEAASKRAETLAKKQQIESILLRKKERELEDMPSGDLEKMLQEMAE